MMMPPLLPGENGHPPPAPAPPLLIEEVEEVLFGQGLCFMDDGGDWRIVKVHVEADSPPCALVVVAVDDDMCGCFFLIEENFVGLLFDLN